MLDCLHPAVLEYVEEFQSMAEARERAVALYKKVRDGFLYDPYHLDLRPEALTASHILLRKRAWCVEKSVVFCAGMRALRIPSRLGFGIVKNHLGAEKLQAYLRREEIVFHGFAEVWLEDRWVKCTPAFDRRICRVSGVEPLEWDGNRDSLFQEYTGSGRFMEYLHFYGSFADVPLHLMHREMRQYYPHLFSHPVDTPEFSFRFVQEWENKWPVSERSLPASG